jgi:hypothetical protein
MIVIDATRITGFTPVLKLSLLMLLLLMLLLLMLLLLMLLRLRWRLFLREW